MNGAILLLEEVAEPPYRLDRVWTHLRNAGVLSRIAGIALGQFLDCEPVDRRYDPHTAREVLVDLATEADLPCITDLPIGHGDVNAPVALGARHRLDATRRDAAAARGRHGVRTAADSASRLGLLAVRISACRARGFEPTVRREHVRRTRGVPRTRSR